MIGLGMSAISDSWGAFAQNVKSVKEYQSLVNHGEKSPVFRGHLLSGTRSFSIRKHILNLMCHFETDWDWENSNDPILNHRTIAPRNGERSFNWNYAQIELKIFEKGRPFVRNVCMAIDAYLQQKEISRTKQFFT